MDCAQFACKNRSVQGHRCHMAAKFGQFVGEHLGSNCLHLLIVGKKNRDLQRKAKCVNVKALCFGNIFKLTQCLYVRIRWVFTYACNQLHNFLHIYATTKCYTFLENTICRI